MDRMLVVGLGNELCGDDGFGPQVLGQLRADPRLACGLELRLAHTDLLCLIDLFADYAQVVLLDAVVDPPSRGEVRLFAEPTFSTWTGASPSGHQLSAVMAIQLFRALYPQASTRVWLVGLCVDRISLGIGLSQPELVRAGVEAVRRLARGQ